MATPPSSGRWPRAAAQPPASRCGMSGGGSRIDDELHLAVEHMEKSKQLRQALPGVRRVQQPIELRHGRAETTGQLSAAQTRAINSSLRFDGELVDQQLSEVARVLIVLERVIDMHCTFGTGFENVGDSFVPELLVDVCRSDPVRRRRAGGELRVRKREGLSRPDRQLELCLAIVDGHLSNLHNKPSFSNSAINRSTRAGACPFMGTRSSRFHFTTSFRPP